MEFETDAQTGVDPLLSGLNPVQREAVLYGNGCLLVLAGAGSGKTRVLTRRLAHLILRRGVPADGVLAVTFTNKAAGEMRSRVESMLGHSVAGLWIGTFHSICLRLLRRHAESAGFPHGITVFDQDDQARLLREVLKAHGDDAENPRLRDLASIISAAKNRMWDPEDLEREWRRPERHRVAALYREYQQKLRDQSGADFDDLLLLGVRLLEENPEIGHRYAQKFRHVLIDEYQDTNHVQFRLARRLSSVHGNLMVVGDDDQSIYRWRGADITNILEFERHFPKAHVLRMTQNYRSTRAILDLANAVVKVNRARHEKSLWTENPQGERPLLHVAEDEEEEARWVIDRIQRSVRAGHYLISEAAILYRVHAQSRPLEEACLNLGVPYVLIGGVVFYQRREVKDLLAYLRLALNPRDEVSFARAVGAPGRGIGAVGLSRIVAAAAGKDKDLARACLELTPESGLKGKALQKARELGGLLQDLASHASSGPEALLRMVCERTEYLSWLRQSGDRDWEEREANVLELLEGAARFQEAQGGIYAEEDGRSLLTAYLDQVALYTSLDQSKEVGERLTLMTVHNAKGLEFGHVFITGLEEGLFPHASSFDDPEELEEERRLFYVAATRAMHSLCLSASIERRRVNRAVNTGLSRFVEEIPREMLEEDRRRVEWNGGGWGLGNGSFGHPGRHPIGGSPRARREEDRDELEQDACDFAAGDDKPAAPASSPAPDLRGRLVRHAIFGVGTVELQEGKGRDARLLVVFPQVGRKKIVARFVTPLAPGPG
jgi:DNA helicase-2/ATP-dependent DNA helicase PcrA